MLMCMTLLLLSLSSKIIYLLVRVAYLPYFFKRVKHVIAFPLTLMFTQLLSVACVPGIWKKAVITPIHKKGPTNVLQTHLNHLCAL